MKLETALTNLEQAQLVRRISLDDALLARDLGVVYQFKHALTQEAAYRSLPRRLRQQVHRQVAECYEKFFADRLDDHAALLAQHYAEAGDAGKAIAYSRRAGDAALRMFAVAEAVAHYERALTLSTSTATATDDLIHLYNCRGRCLELASRFADALGNYEEMEHLAHERGDVRLEMAAIMAQARLFSTVNPLFDPALGRERAENALTLAKKLGDQRAEAEVYWNLMNQARFGDGLFPLAIEYGEQAMKLARDAQWNEQLAFILNDLADVYFETVAMDKGRAVVEEAHTLFCAANNLPMLADNLCVIGSFFTWSGEFDKALSCFDEALTLGQRIQNEWVQAFAHGWRGLAWWALGEYGKAMSDFGASATLADRAGFLVGQFMPRILLAVIYAELGEYAKATQMALTSLTAIEQGVHRFAPIAQSVLAYLLTLAGEHGLAARYERENEASNLAFGLQTYHYQNLAQMELALWKGQPERALALSQPHMELLAANRLIPMLVDVLLLHGRALVALKQGDVARAVLEQARTYAQEMGLERSLWRILAALAELAAPAESSTLRAEAVALVQRIADRLPTVELRATFLNQPEIVGMALL